MVKYSDDEIRNMKKITCKIAGDYLGIGPMAVSIGSEMICCQLVLRFIMKTDMLMAGVITLLQSDSNSL